MESPIRSQKQDTKLPALAVALQHPAVAADQRNICTMLQVSKAWRTAVQQSAASLTDIKFYKHVTLHNSNVVSSFARWLAKHSGVICNLSIHPKHDQEESVAVAWEVVQHLIELGLQAAATASITNSPVDRVRPQLQLRSYTSTVPPTAAMLAALPAATLTRLQLAKVANSDWYLGLSQLTSLRQLTLNMGEIRSQHPAALGCFMALSNLKMLTKLDLSCVPRTCDTKMLPVQLQELDLQIRVGDATDSSPFDADSAVVDLQHLTCLRQLQLDARELAKGSSVPCNLSYLKLSVAWWKVGAVSGLSSLGQLNSLELDVQRIGSQHLEPFKQLTQLQELSLIVGEDANPLEVANAWGDLPLRDLQLEQVHSSIPYSDVMQLTQRIIEATALTRLNFWLTEVAPHHLDAEKLTVCKHLSSLTNLQELGLNIGFPDDFEEHDAQHLAALVRLTSLSLCHCGSGPYVDATTLCLLAVKLTNLEELRVREETDYVHEVCSTAALPAIARLTTLKELCLEYLPLKAAERGLQLLTDLTRLTVLEGFYEASDEAMQAFWNNIKSSRE